MEKNHLNSLMVSSQLAQGSKTNPLKLKWQANLFHYSVTNVSCNSKCILK